MKSGSQASSSAPHAKRSASNAQTRVRAHALRVLRVVRIGDQVTLVRGSYGFARTTCVTGRLGGRLVGDRVPGVLSMRRGLIDPAYVTHINEIGVDVYEPRGKAAAVYVHLSRRISAGASLTASTSCSIGASARRCFRSWATHSDLVRAVGS